MEKGVGSWGMLQRAEFGEYGGVACDGKRMQGRGKGDVGSLRDAGPEGCSVGKDLRM